MDGGEYKATVQVSFQATERDENFFCSPYWIDSICHSSGFVIKDNDTIDSEKQMYIPLCTSFLFNLLFKVVLID